MTFQTDIYLARIALANEAIEPTAAGLARLQNAQMRAIAFENIDVLVGIVPDLEPASLWQKLVLSARGGYCLELNALFGQALEAFGFSFRPVLGRVRMGAESGGPRAHHAFIVTIDGTEWLADTGFGGPAPAAPVRIGTGEAQEILGENFRIRRDGTTDEDVLERWTGGGWFALYGFDRVPVTEPDYAAANFVCARAGFSPFPAHLMMTILTADGRVSVFDRTVKTVQDAEIVSVDLAGPAELASLFAGPFRLRCAPDLVDRTWSRIAPGRVANGA